MTTNLRLARSLAHRAVVHREGEHPDGGLDFDEQGRPIFPPTEKERQRRRAHYLASLAKRKKKRKGKKQ